MYKRQVKSGGGSQGQGIDLPRGKCVEFRHVLRPGQICKRRHDLEPVSYTHLDVYKRQIHIFIDKVDQAFSKDLQRIHGNSRLSRNASFWQYSQYSLACAAYEILSANSHIKVYFSIRQEALIDAHIIAGNLKRNINTYIVSLQYSREDLFELFNLYVLKEHPTNLVNRHSQKNNQLEAFIGQNSFRCV